jgi:hypothetical protein
MYFESLFKKVSSIPSQTAALPVLAPLLGKLATYGQWLAQTNVADKNLQEQTNALTQTLEEADSALGTREEILAMLELVDRIRGDAGVRYRLPLVDPLVEACHEYAAGWLVQAEERSQGDVSDHEAMLRSLTEAFGQPDWLESWDEETLAKLSCEFERVIGLAKAEMRSRLRPTPLREVLASVIE